MFILSISIIIVFTVIALVIENMSNTFKIHRLKAKAREAYYECNELLDCYGCGHSMAMQMPSYNQAYTEYQKTITKLKLIDPNYPKD